MRVVLFLFLGYPAMRKIERRVLEKSLIEVPQQLEQLQVEAHIAERHPLLKGLVDDSIYSNDREFRLPGSTKYGKSAVLGPVNPNTSYSDMVVSWLDRHEECQKIEVQVPLNVAKRKHASADPPRKRARGEVGQQGHPQDDAETRARMLKLVQDQVIDRLPCPSKPMLPPEQLVFNFGCPPGSHACGCAFCRIS